MKRQRDHIEKEKVQSWVLVLVKMKFAHFALRKSVVSPPL